MPFFTSTPKKPSPVFAGVDDPFNFPSAKMRYTTRSSSRTSSPDSGYGSIDDDDAQLSPKSSALPQSKRRLKKDGKGHWRMHSYEYQSTEKDCVAERTPIMAQDATFSSPAEEKTRTPDDAHMFVANPRRTFTLICDEGAQAGAQTKVKSMDKAVSKSKSKPKSKPQSMPKEKEKEGWFERRVYGRALQRRERSEGVSELQRQMAPVLRRASPAPERELVHRRPSASKQRPSAGQRKGSTLLHPSPPPSAPSSRPVSPRGTFGIKTTIVGGGADETAARGRTRKPSTLLHPSPPPGRPARSLSSPTTQSQEREHHPPEALRSPRHRSQTPLRIPSSAASQPTPTPLRIRFPTRRRPSVLHSCFSSSDEHDDNDNDDDDADSASDVDTVAGVCDVETWSVSSGESGSASLSPSLSLSVGGVHNEVILARTGMVARAQRVRVGGGKA